jgi:hypothetical protein
MIANVRLEILLTLRTTSSLEDVFTLLYLTVPLISLRCRGCFYILFILQTVGLLGGVINMS